MWLNPSLRGSVKALGIHVLGALIEKEKQHWEQTNTSRMMDKNILV